MKIPTSVQIQELDQFTIQNEPVASIALMERAAQAFTEWFFRKFTHERPVYIFCGPGNNGGDGLAIARMLLLQYDVHVLVCRVGSKTTPDFDANLIKLGVKSKVVFCEIKEDDMLPVLPKGAILIDGIFGSGLNRPAEGYWAVLLEHLNRQDAVRVAIDVPSGMFADRPTTSVSFLADHTLSFQFPKLGFLLPENAHRVGEWAVVPIGLHPVGMAQTRAINYYLTPNVVRPLYRPRKKFSHKGTYGHALLLAGSYGMVGAALLSARAALRIGAGLVTLHAPQVAYSIIQSQLPEAMVSIDAHPHYLSSMPAIEKYQAIGVGPGIGQEEKTRNCLRQLVEKVNRPMVLDADALNIMATHQDILQHIPKNSILTPHPKEFERLFGKTANDFDRLKQQRTTAQALGVYIILKGAHTCIATPEGDCYFNSTGNPGMATAGSGDVLTGILTGLLAQGYPPQSTALLGVYLHGLAGDLALEKVGSEESLLASDLVAAIGKAFHLLKAAS